MKRIIVVLVALVSLGITAVAGDMDDQVVEKVKKVKKARADKVKKAKPVLEEMTLKGVISKTEIENKAEGKKAVVKYVLTDTDGNKINLPKARKKKKQDDGAVAPINLDECLDTGVTVIAKGTRVKKNGKEKILLKEIIEVRKASAASDIDIFQKDAVAEDVE